MKLIRLIKGNRIRLPTEYLERNKISEGNFLQYEILEDSIIIKPLRIPKNPTKNLFGIAVTDSVEPSSGDELFLLELNEKKKRDLVHDLF